MDCYIYRSLTLLNNLLVSCFDCSDVITKIIVVKLEFKQLEVANEQSVIVFITLCVSKLNTRVMSQHAVQ